jgi:hypothetical protein
MNSELFKKIIKNLLKFVLKGIVAIVTTILDIGIKLEYSIQNQISLLGKKSSEDPISKVSSHDLLNDIGYIHTEDRKENN